MGFEVQTQTCSPGQTVQFTFQNQLQSWVLGLMNFALTYGPTTNHWIETLSISLQGGLPERAASVANVLSGLRLGYNDIDHEYQGSTASCGIVQQGSVGVLNATANIWDSSGNSATITAIDAGVLASVDDPPPLMVQRVTLAGQTVTVSPLQFPSGVSQAVALIQNFNVQYASGDHGVQSLEVGCMGLTILGNTVTPGQFAFYTWDGDGHYSDDSTSYVGLLVVAVPAPASA